MATKTGVLLVNLGTPDSTSNADLRKYLREFLMDERVIDVPFVNRWMLVNLIIAPLRGPKSAAEYRKVWTDQGSPLLYYSEEVTKKLQSKLGDDYMVELGMRYQNPSLEKALDKFYKKAITKIVVIPLYPQYASATTGSSIQKVMEIIGKWEIIPEIDFVSRYPNRKDFIEAFAKVGKEYVEKEDWDHFVFSYHGLPERQIMKASVDNYCKLGKCCNSYHGKNEYCYRAQCFETTRHMAVALNIPEDKYTVSFQSRLGKTPWIQPYTDDTIPKLREAGHEKVLVFSPSFTADCLETTVEIGEMYKEMFEDELGGKKWELVPSLNTSDDWVDSLKNMVMEHMPEGAMK